VLIANVDRPPFPRGVIHRYSAALWHFSAMERKATSDTPNMALVWNKGSPNETTEKYWDFILN
jgi:hypothetical protein